MGKFSSYDISLKSLADGKHTFNYLLEDDFFEKIDSPEVRKGTVNAKIVVSRNKEKIEIDFMVKGTIQIPCTRCLDDMTQAIDVKEKLFVKFGKQFSEEGDDILIVPEDSGILNVAWFLYETIALAIPIKHVHAAGECNETMTKKLKQYEILSDEELMDEDELIDDNEETENDPRWDALRNINDNN